MKRLLIVGFLFGVAVFTLFSCQKEISVESNSNNASFSLLNDSTKVCLDTPAISGKYYNGVTAALPGNSVSVVVNVKTTGNYVIETDSPNGFSFADSGFFSKTGLITIVLKPRGKPTLIKYTDFTVADATCPFTIRVEDSTGTGLGGVDTTGADTTTSGYSKTYVDPKPASDDSWHFTDSTNNKSYSGKMPSPGTFFLSPILAGSGSSSSNAAEIFNFAITTPAVTVGSYPLNGSNTVGLTNTAGSIPTVEYSAVGATPEEEKDSSSINITSYSGGRLKISFRCWAEDGNGKSALIKGSINSKVQ